MSILFLNILTLLAPTQSAEVEEVQALYLVTTYQGSYVCECDVSVRVRNLDTLMSYTTVFLRVIPMFQGITSSTKNVTIKSRPMTIAECAELDCTSARFGFSLADIGDLDQDGYGGRHLHHHRKFM